MVPKPFFAALFFLLLVQPGWTFSNPNLIEATQPLPGSIYLSTLENYTMSLDEYFRGYKVTFFGSANNGRQNATEFPIHNAIELLDTAETPDISSRKFIDQVSLQFNGYALNFLYFGLDDQSTLFAVGFYSWNNETRQLADEPRVFSNYSLAALEESGQKCKRIVQSGDALLIFCEEGEKGLSVGALYFGDFPPKLLGSTARIFNHLNSNEYSASQWIISAYYDESTDTHYLAIALRPGASSLSLFSLTIDENSVSVEFLKEISSSFNTGVSSSISSLTFAGNSLLFADSHNKSVYSVSLDSFEVMDLGVSGESVFAVRLAENVKSVFLLSRGQSSLNLVELHLYSFSVFTQIRNYTLFDFEEEGMIENPSIFYIKRVFANPDFLLVNWGEACTSTTKSNCVQTTGLRVFARNRENIKYLLSEVNFLEDRLVSFDEYANQFITTAPNSQTKYYQIQLPYLEIVNLHESLVVDLNIYSLSQKQTQVLKFKLVKEDDMKIYSPIQEVSIDLFLPESAQFCFQNALSGFFDEQKMDTGFSWLENFAEIPINVTILPNKDEVREDEKEEQKEFKFVFGKVLEFNGEFITVSQVKLGSSTKFHSTVSYCTGKRSSSGVVLSLECQKIDSNEKYLEYADAFIHNEKLLIFANNEKDSVIVASLAPKYNEENTVKLDFDCEPQSISKINMISYLVCLQKSGVNAPNVYFVEADSIVNIFQSEILSIKAHLPLENGEIPDRLYALAKYPFDYVIKTASGKLFHTNLEFKKLSDNSPFFLKEISELSSFIEGDFELMTDSEHIYVISLSNSAIYKFNFERPYTYTFEKSLLLDHCDLISTKYGASFFEKFLFVFANCTDFEFNQQRPALLVLEPERPYRETLRAKHWLSEEVLILGADSILSIAHDSSHPDIATYFSVEKLFDGNYTEHVMTFSAFNEPCIFIKYNTAAFGYNIETDLFKPFNQIISDKLTVSTSPKEKESHTASIDFKVNVSEYMNIIHVNPASQFVEWSWELAPVDKLYPTLTNESKIINVLPVNYSNFIKSHVATTLGECGSPSTRYDSEAEFVAIPCNETHNNIFIPNEVVESLSRAIPPVALVDVLAALTTKADLKEGGNARMSINKTDFEYTVFPLVDRFNRTEGVSFNHSQPIVFPNIDSDSIECNIVVKSINAPVYYILCQDIYFYYEFYVARVETSTTDLVVSYYTNSLYLIDPSLCRAVSTGFLACLQTLSTFGELDSSESLMTNVIGFDTSEVGGEIQFLMAFDSEFLTGQSDKMIKSFTVRRDDLNTTNSVVALSAIVEGYKTIFEITVKPQDNSDSNSEAEINFTLLDLQFTVGNPVFLDYSVSTSFDQYISYLIGTDQGIYYSLNYDLTIGNFNGMNFTKNRPGGIRPYSNFVPYGRHQYQGGKLGREFAVFKEEMSLFIYALNGVCNEWELNEEQFQNCNSFEWDRNVVGQIDVSHDQFGDEHNARALLSYDILPALKDDPFCQEYLYVTLAQTEFGKTSPGITEVVCLANFFTVQYHNVSETAFRLTFSNEFTSASTEIYFNPISFFHKLMGFIFNIYTLLFVLLICCSCLVIGIYKGRAYHKAKVEMSIDALDSYRRFTTNQTQPTP